MKLLCMSGDFARDRFSVRSHDRIKFCQWFDRSRARARLDISGIGWFSLRHSASKDNGQPSYGGIVLALAEMHYAGRDKPHGALVKSFEQTRFNLAFTVSVLRSIHPDNVENERG